MAYTATINTYLSLVGNGVNEQSVPMSTPYQATNSPGQRIPTTLNSGDNTIVPPQSPQPTAGICYVLLPTGANITLKGVGGDTGYLLGSANPSIPLQIPVGTGSGPGGYTGSFILNASSQCVVTIWWL